MGRVSVSAGVRLVSDQMACNIAECRTSCEQVAVCCLLIHPSFYYGVHPGGLRNFNAITSKNLCRRNSGVGVGVCERNIKIHANKCLKSWVEWELNPGRMVVGQLF